MNCQKAIPMVSGIFIGCPPWKSIHTPKETITPRVVISMVFNSPSRIFLISHSISPIKKADMGLCHIRFLFPCSSAMMLRCFRLFSCLLVLTKQSDFRRLGSLSWFLSALDPQLCAPPFRVVCLYRVLMYNYYPLFIRFVKWQIWLFKVIHPPHMGVSTNY